MGRQIFAALLYSTSVVKQAHLLTFLLAAHFKKPEGWLAMPYAALSKEWPKNMLLFPEISARNPVLKNSV